MKLQTKVEITPYTEKISYKSNIITIGSCFAERIGAEMARSKFQVSVNPMGTLFNPLSIAAAIDRLTKVELITEEDMIRGNGAEPAWYNFDFHSSLFKESAAESACSINHVIREASQALLHADWVVITLGTAWTYELISSGKVVANCHKRPMREFNRRRLSVCEISESLSTIVEGALKDKNIIFTVSPIRHIGDGLTENSLSKATLRLSIEELTTRFKNVQYFPSYEILIDELRDYRFYERDMVHVAPIAVEYIWERFMDTSLSPETQKLYPQVMQIIRASEHRPVNPNSEQHRKFTASQLKAIETIPEVDFTHEREYFLSQKTTKE